MADLLSDEDMGITPAPAAPPAAASGLLSDADMGITPSAPSGLLTNSGDEGLISGGAKNVATGVIKGAGDAVGAVGNIGNMADYVMDRGEQGVRYLAGNSKPLDQIQADNAAARQKTAASQNQTSIGSLGNAIDPRNVLPNGQQVSGPILARTGNYEPDSYLGKLAQSGIEAAVGSIGPGGGGAEAGVTRNALLGTVAKQAPIIASTGAVGQGVSDETGDPLLGMAAGATAGAAAAGTIHGVNRAIEPFAEKLPIVGGAYTGTQDRLAGQKLVAAAQDPATFKNNLSPGPMQPGSDSPIPGFNPTTAQLTGDVGIAQAERGDAAINPGPYIERRNAQNLAVSKNIDAMTPAGSPEAVTAHLKDNLAGIDANAEQQIQLAQQASQGLASQIGAGVGPEVMGDELRGHVAMANDAATASERKLWRAVDPDNSLANSVGGIKQAANSIYGGLTDTAKAFVSPEEQKLTGLISSYNPVEPFQQVADLRSNLASAMRQERATNGSTPAYARMSQLMGSVQDTINNAIEGRAAQEAHAVNQGTMSPEDTMVARIRDQWNLGAGQQSAGVQGYSATGTGGAGGTTAGASRIYGTAGQGGRGAGASKGDQGVQTPPLQPNFDQAAADRIKAASTATKERHQVYDNGIIGDMLASKGTAGDYKLSNSAVPAKVFPGGPKGYDAVKQFQRATNNAPEADLSLHNAYAEMVRAKAIGADGMVDPNKLAQINAVHQHGLRAIDESTPGFSKRFDSAANATNTVMAERSAQKAMRDHYLDGIVGKLVGADGPDEVVGRFGKIMNADDRVAQINKLINATKSNPDAVEGLRKTAADWMARQFKTQTEIGDTGTTQVSANAFKKIVDQKAPVLDRLFSPDEMANFKKIAHALDVQNRSITSKLAGSPGTAQDLNQAAKHGHGAPASNIMQAVKNGALAGYVAHGPHGAAAGAATGAFGHVVGSLRAMGIHTVQDMFSDALQNPERARYYLSKVPEPTQNAMGKALSANIRRSFLTTEDFTKKNEKPAARARGGYVPSTDPERDIRHALAVC